MPLLFPPGTRVSDADGNPLNDAQVRVYLANTTTLADLYSDAALSVPLSNPVITNAAGYPTSDGTNETLIWIASGDYDTAFLTSGGSVLVSWPDAPTYGEGAGDIDLTVSGNGRFKVTGSAGAVQMQVGDPSPDNSGGTLTISGWAGTQGDTLTLTFNQVNTTGRLKENSAKLSGVVQTEATSFSAASTVDVPLSNSPAGVRAWRVTFYDLTASAGAPAQFRFSYDGGGTFKSGAADYAYGADYNVDTVATSTASAGASLINGPNILAAARKTVIQLLIITPDSGAGDTVLSGQISGYESGSAKPSAMLLAGYGLGDYGRATHLRLLATGQTVTGKYVVERLYGFGD